MNYHYLNPQVFSPSFYFLRILQERGVNKRLGGCLAVDQDQPVFHFRVCKNNSWTYCFLLLQIKVTYQLPLFLCDSVSQVQFGHLILTHQSVVPFY